MYVKVNGEIRYLWRAVDHEVEILESFVTKTRDEGAALAFMKKAMKRYGKPEMVVTDGLRSYGVAMTHIGNAKRREVGRWLNNRVENSHLPFRRRERAMQRFRQMKTLQQFISGMLRRSPVRTALGAWAPVGRHRHREEACVGFRWNAAAAAAQRLYELCRLWLFAAAQYAYFGETCLGRVQRVKISPEPSAALQRMVLLWTNR